MALRDQPYLPLFVQDFLTDEKLAECSPATIGVYIRLMCLMHKSEYYGKILLKQKYKQEKNFASCFACQVSKNLLFPTTIVEAAFEELLAENVLKIEGDFLIQKRMVRDNEISCLRASAGKRGGIKTGKFLKKNKAEKFAKAKSEAKHENEYTTEYESVIDMDKGVQGEKEINHHLVELVRKEFPAVASMKKPLTDSEAEKLLQVFDEQTVIGIFQSMENYAKLKTNNISTYLTAKKWIEKDLNNQNGKSRIKPHHLPASEKFGGLSKDYVERTISKGPIPDIGGI